MSNSNKPVLFYFLRVSHSVGNAVGQSVTQSGHSVITQIVLLSGNRTTHRHKLENTRSLLLEKLSFEIDHSADTTVDQVQRW